MLHENDGVSSTLLDGFPKVAGLVRKVYDLDFIQQYYEERGFTFDAKALKLRSIKGCDKG